MLAGAGSRNQRNRDAHIAHALRPTWRGRATVVPLFDAPGLSLHAGRRQARPRAALDRRWISDTRMDLIERKSVKLLAQGSRLLAEMSAEALCDEPQRFVIKKMLGELRELLDEFEDAYLDDAGGR
jgi:hypothetical protein